MQDHVITFATTTGGDQRQSQGKRQAYMQHCSCVSCRGRHTPATHLLCILQCRIIVLQAGLRMYTCVCICVWAWEAMGWLWQCPLPAPSPRTALMHGGSTTHAHTSCMENWATHTHTHLRCRPVRPEHMVVGVQSNRLAEGGDRVLVLAILKVGIALGLRANSTASVCVGRLQSVRDRGEPCGCGVPCVRSSPSARPPSACSRIYMIFV